MYRMWNYFYNLRDSSVCAFIQVSPHFEPDMKVKQGLATKTAGERNAIVQHLQKLNQPGHNQTVITPIKSPSRTLGSHHNPVKKHWQNPVHACKDKNKEEFKKFLQL
ncbi:hypothetical protein CEXT_212621 [Caerostris extrusa]|uniref:Uncharacterized protein n=1 Tax=Caerostris extrusa TaxID=172846 RepID=A0AAV4TSZ8_CAEEX|nr:hypothetical protein CEXT_212621 [Caerostris extrusa]